MSFSIKETQVAKGVAIILMVYHHLFFDKAISEPYGIIVPLLGEGLWYQGAQLAKVCVAVFVFLSAFGIAKSTKKWRKKTITQRYKDVQITVYIIKRYISVMAGFLFVFVITVSASYLLHNTGIGLSNPNGVYGTGFYGALYLLLDGLGLSFISGNPTLNPEWWYMSIAILIIFTMPLFLQWYEKSGIISWGCCLFLSFPLYILLGEGVGHLMLLPLGIAFAENDWFEKLKLKKLFKQDNAVAKISSKVLRLVAAFACLFISLNFALVNNGFYFGYHLAAPVLIYICYEAFSSMPILGDFLALLGGHSMNIYFTHTTLMRIFTDELFSLRYGALIVLVLLLASMVLSILLEQIKRLTRYNALTQKIAKTAQDAVRSAWKKAM